jgi:hypothetical protein
MEAPDDAKLRKRDGRIQRDQGLAASGPLVRGLLLLSSVPGPLPMPHAKIGSVLVTLLDGLVPTTQRMKQRTRKR